MHWLALLLQRVDYRKVLEDDKAGKMKIEVQQVLVTKPYAASFDLSHMTRTGA